MVIGCGWWMVLYANMLLNCCFIIRILWMRIKNRELKQSNHDLKDNVEDYRRELKDSAKVHEEMRIVRHDFIHHINEIERLAYCGSRNQVLHYLEGVRGMVEDTRRRNVTEYAGISSVVDIFIARARRLGAAVTCDIQLPKDWDCGRQEFNTVIGNLFENALRAVKDMAGEQNAALSDDVDGEQNVDLVDGTVKKQKQVLSDDVAEKQPWIEVKIFYHKGALYILVKNSYSGTVVKMNEGFATKKNGTCARHGLGLKSVGRIVKAHSGVMDVTAEKGVFSVSIMMYM